mmetsp:Transcript_4380/g.27900  ORF Transcript_4380/g.27900 Transcript_4380/m.27900 type:complete len:281 (+) Transcript_4380:1481-2323(+)
MSNECSCEDADRVLRCAQCNCGKHGAVSPLCHKDEAGCLDHGSPEGLGHRRFRFGIFHFFFCFFPFLCQFFLRAHERSWHLDCLVDGLQAKENEQCHGQIFSDRHRKVYAVRNSLEHASDDHGDRRHGTKGKHGSCQHSGRTSFHGQQCGDEERLISDLRHEDQGQSGREPCAAHKIHQWRVREGCCGRRRGSSCASSQDDPFPVGVRRHLSSFRRCFGADGSPGARPPSHARLRDSAPTRTSRSIRHRRLVRHVRRHRHVALVRATSRHASCGTALLAN